MDIFYSSGGPVSAMKIATIEKAEMSKSPLSEGTEQNIITVNRRVKYFV